MDTSDAAETIGEIVRDAPLLSGLQFQRCNIFARGTTPLRFQTRLNWISFCGERVSDATIDAIYAMLFDYIRDNTVKRICNVLGVSAARTLAHYVGGVPTLQYLYFVECNISGRGLRTLDRLVHSRQHGWMRVKTGRDAMLRSGPFRDDAPDFFHVHVQN